MAPPKDNRPIAILGAGDLISHLHRGQTCSDSPVYEFNLFRFTENREATHQLTADHLWDLVKLCQILAFAIRDDGWLSPETHESLTRLFEELYELTRGWDESSSQVKKHTEKEPDERVQP